MQATTKVQFDGSEGITEYSSLQKQDGGGRKRATSTLIGKLRSARKRYSSSFTIHAMAHIIDGTVPEKVFWTIILLGAITFAVYMSWSLFVAFFMHDVHTKFKEVLKRGMHLPTVYICQKDFYGYLYSYNDCSTNVSKSYDVDVCTALNQRCPRFFLNSAYYRRMSKSNNYTVDSVSCQRELLGQCIAINAYGKFVQTHKNTYMEYKQSINASMLPLNVLIYPPGMGELAGHWFYNKEIDRLGEYHIPLEKATVSRLPYPYSRPSCIVQDSTEAGSRNMFTGSYTTVKCKKTCDAKLHLMCGMIENKYRLLVKDQVSFKKLLVDKNVTQFQECIDTNWRNGRNDVALEECIAKCYQPCADESYTAQIFYRRLKEQQIYLKFYFKEMVETSIIETPSYEASTLLANFGGTLGLMTGMSAISIIELVMWLILFLVGRIHLFYKKLTTPSKAHDLVV